MTWPEPTREKHERFCKTEEWDRVRDARGRTGTHHVTYELGLPDGRTLRTRISHPVDRTGYGPAIWAHILRDQLEVGHDVFWRCVLEGVLPDRGAARSARSGLPADLIHMLIHKVGLADDEVAAMTKEEAVDRMRRYWTEGR